MKKFDVLSLGEILLRLSPPRYERMVRGEAFEKTVGGAEVNVLSGLSLLGLKTGIVSRIPHNDIGRFCRNKVRFVGVSDDYLIYDESGDGRVGVYYYESGAYPRKPRIVYDRKNSSMWEIDPDEFPEEMYASTKCFHTTGITMALSPQCKKATIEMIKRFTAAGAFISFDVNFRSNLWSGEEARKSITEILPYVDIFFCSETTAQLTFGKTGSLEEMMRSFTEEYPISYVASTQRIVHSPKVHTFGSMIYEAKTDIYYEEAPYTNIDVVDRIGSGDAYISGVLYGLMNFNYDCQKALEYGNATGAIKNTIPGDMQASGQEEVGTIIANHQTNDQSEMVR